MPGGWDHDENQGPMEEGRTHRTSSADILVMYPIPMSEARGCEFEYWCSFLWEELSGSASGPMMHEGEWPEEVARSEKLPDCEHIKWLSVKFGCVRTIRYVVRIGHCKSSRAGERVRQGGEAEETTRRDKIANSREGASIDQPYNAQSKTCAGDPGGQGRYNAPMLESQAANARVFGVVQRRHLGDPA